MSQVHSSGTKPERILCRSLWHIGFRYRLNIKYLPGSPDIVLPKYRTVIFVHGCFWHGHKGCKRSSIPKTNTDFWTNKITRNQERDQEVWRQLEARGWYVIIIWECQLKKALVDETIAQVAAEIRQNGETLKQIAVDKQRIRKEYQLEVKSRKAQEASLKAEIKQLLHEKKALGIL